MTLSFRNLATEAARPTNKFVEFVLGSQHSGVVETEKLAREVQTLLFIKEDRMRHEAGGSSEKERKAREEQRKEFYHELMSDPVRLRKEVGADYMDPLFMAEFEEKKLDLDRSSYWKPVPPFPTIFMALYKDKSLLTALRYIQVGVCLRNKMQDEIGRKPEDEGVKSPTLKVFKNDPDSLKIAISRLDDLNDKEKKRISDGWTVYDAALRDGFRLLKAYPEVAASLREALDSSAPAREHLVVDTQGRPSRIGSSPALP